MQGLGIICCFAALVVVKFSRTLNTCPLQCVVSAIWASKPLLVCGGSFFSVGFLDLSLHLTFIKRWVWSTAWAASCTELGLPHEFYKLEFCTVEQSLYSKALTTSSPLCYNFLWFSMPVSINEPANCSDHDSEGNSTCTSKSDIAWKGSLSFNLFQ